MIVFFESIRDLLKSFINTLIALFKVLIMSRFNIKLPQKRGKEIAFFANGASLNEALKKIKQEGLPQNIMVTNFFCNSDYFYELKPNHYTICDPLFKYKGFKEDNRVAEFYNILFNVDWDIALFIPFFFKKDIQRIIKDGGFNNGKIKIYYYNSVNFNGNNSFLLKLIKLKLGIPRPTTVAVPALVNCMHIGYTDIKIAGVDLNHHESIKVSKENTLQIKSKHFYNNEETEIYQPWYKDKTKGITYKTSEIFLVFHHFFYSFDVLSNFADKYNVKIVNYSEESYLDQFKKV